MGHCVEMDAGSPYLPFVEILEEALIGPHSPIAYREAWAISLLKSPGWCQGCDVSSRTWPRRWNCLPNRPAATCGTASPNSFAGHPKSGPFYWSSKTSTGATSPPSISSSISPRSLRPGRS